MKIWIDDIRLPPAGWRWVKTSEEAINIIKKFLPKITDISFDHDLGGEDTSIPVAELLEELAFNKKKFDIRLHIHSANPVGRKNLELIFRSIKRFLPN